MGSDGTSIGGPIGDTPQTAWSVILGARDPNDPQCREKWERLISEYWKPVYWWIRRSRVASNEQAKDLTQEFFSTFLEKNLLESVSPDKGRFRSFLKVTLRNFLTDQHRRGTAEMRGGGTRVMRIDAIVSTDDLWEPPSDAAGPEEVFDARWAEHLLKTSLDELRARLIQAGKPLYFDLFERYFLSDEGVTLEEIARQNGIKLSDVRNHLGYTKPLFRKIVRERILQYVSTSAEADQELNDLFRSLQ